MLVGMKEKNIYLPKQINVEYDEKRMFQVNKYHTDKMRNGFGTCLNIVFLLSETHGLLCIVWFGCL